jgi:hypothetical protein
VLAIALWAGLSWHTIHSVYLGRWIAREDWRPTSAFAAQHTRPDTQVYSFLPDMFAFGVAYYQPQLEPHGRYLPMDAASAGQAVAALELHRDDLIVTLVPDVGDGSAADRLLTSRGFAHRDFPGEIRVYYMP